MASKRPKTSQREKDPQDPQRAPLPRLIAIELGHSFILGGDVRVVLSPNFTLLVGRNGVGKSAILDAIEASARAALHGVSRATSAPLRFRFDIDLDGRKLAFEANWQPQTRAQAPTDADPEPAFMWAERCWDLETNVALWTVESGKAILHTPTATTIAMPGGMGLLAIDVNGLVGQGVATAFRRVLANVLRIGAGVPRVGERAIPYLTRDKGARGRWRTPTNGNRVDRIGVALLNWFDSDRERFEEFADVGRRMGVWDRISVETIEIGGTDQRPRVPTVATGPTGPTGPIQISELGLVRFDKTILGELSDGTLRVAEMLRFVISPIPRFLLIEEPETSLHPGMLQRLLDEFKAYRDEHQTLMSTHSPQVVASLEPEDLRLVTRSGDGVTRVRALTADQRSRVNDYLCNEGHLGEFVFGGGADD